MKAKSEALKKKLKHEHNFKSGKCTCGEIEKKFKGTAEKLERDEEDEGADESKEKSELKREKREE